MSALNGITLYFSSVGQKKCTSLFRVSQGQSLDVGRAVFFFGSSADEFSFKLILVVGRIEFYTTFLCLTSPFLVDCWLRLVLFFSSSYLCSLAFDLLTLSSKSARDIEWLILIN
jgi:hypothetical protein